MFGFKFKNTNSLKFKVVSGADETVTGSGLFLSNYYLIPTGRGTGEKHSGITLSPRFAFASFTCLLNQGVPSLLPLVYNLQCSSNIYNQVAFHVPRGAAY